VGKIATLTKQLSEADIALFELVTGDAPLAREEPPDPRRGPREAAPLSLLAALLAAAAARHAARPDQARFLSQTVRFAEPALTDDTVTATAKIVGHDPTEHSLRIKARCENDEGRLLADGTFVLRED
jgi:acyl dehydratase